MYVKVGTDWYKVRVLSEALVHELDPEFIAKRLDDPRRFDPLSGVSAKGIGSRRATSYEKNVLAAFTKALSPTVNARTFSKAQIAWDTYKETMRTDFVSLVKQLEAGSITKNQFISKSRVVFKAGYEKAYRLGTDAAGLDFMRLPAEDIRWLQKARSQEYTFLNKFADDVVAGKGSMDYETRASMYIDTVDSMFDAGRVEGNPNESTWVYWELGVADHCGDCIDLALNSPYRPDELPTTPGAGDTRCLSNCGCSLRIRYERPEKIEFDIKPVPQSVAKELGLWGIGLGAVALYKRYLQYKEKESVTTTVSAPDIDDYEYWGSEYESVQAFDWNAVDDAVSALALSRASDLTENREQRAKIRIEAAQEFESACQKLPDWMNPFDTRTLLAWHGVGTNVLEYVNSHR